MSLVLIGYQYVPLIGARADPQIKRTDYSTTYPSAVLPMEKEMDLGVH